MKLLIASDIHGAAGYCRVLRGKFGDLALNANPGMKLGF